MFVSCEFCALSGTGLCGGPITVQKSLTEPGVSECEREASTRRRP